MGSTYKKHYDRLSGEWHVFHVHDGMEDYIDTFGTPKEAQVYCDQRNCLCHEIAGDNAECPVHGAGK